jgi:pseudouridine kinase
LKLVTPNCAEAEILCDRPVDASKPNQVMDAAKCLVGQGVRFAVITLAQFGVCYATSEVHGQVPAIHTEIVDPTGGGDALTGAVLFGLLNEIPFDDAIRLGVSAAALTLRYPGAVIPDLSLERLYDQLVI